MGLFIQGFLVGIVFTFLLCYVGFRFFIWKTQKKMQDSLQSLLGGFNPMGEQNE